MTRTGRGRWTMAVLFLDYFSSTSVRCKEALVKSIRDRVQGICSPNIVTKCSRLAGVAIPVQGQPMKWLLLICPTKILKQNYWTKDC